MNASTSTTVSAASGAAKVDATSSSSSRRTSGGGAAGDAAERIDQRQRVPAQRIRVLVAGRLQADAPDADQDLGAVGDHQRLADEVGGAAVALAAPVDVLVANRGGDLGRLAVVGRVVAAHDPLQLGKLADHVGQQVGLGQQRGAIGQRCVGADAGGDPGRDAPHAPDAIALAAELAVVDDLVERRNARLERALPVLVVEELRVGQARPDDALVAFDDARRVAGAMLLTTRKRLVSRPSASSSGK
jgi:hypothetical protein